MRIFERDGVKLVKLDWEEVSALEEASKVLQELRDIDGTFYITDEDEEGSEELNNVINAVEGIDFVVLEEN